ncbi:MAG TPA: TRAP transporter small permease subunit [Candidatus Binatia bacterium]|nr:TRAP transporter small permease subunit [Candidatus Binatia bacterium]
MARLLKTLRSAMERLLGAIVGLLMISLAGVVVVAVIYRKAGASLVWYDEIVSILLAWLTYYAAALAALKRAHLGYSGIVDALPPFPRLVTIWVGEIFVFAFFILLAWSGYHVLLVLRGDTLVSLPEVPIQLTQSVIPIGAILFVIAEALTLPDMLRNPHSGRLASRHNESSEATGG